MVKINSIGMDLVLVTNDCVIYLAFIYCNLLSTFMTEQGFLWLQSSVQGMSNQYPKIKIWEKETCSVCILSTWFGLTFDVVIPCNINSTTYSQGVMWCFLLEFLFIMYGCCKRNCICCNILCLCCRYYCRSCKRYSLHSRRDYVQSKMNTICCKHTCTCSKGTMSQLPYLS